jgi:hypothetical protein
VSTTNLLCLSTSADSATSAGLEDVLGKYVAARGGSSSVVEATGMKLGTPPQESARRRATEWTEDAGEDPLAPDDFKAAVRLKFQSSSDSDDLDLIDRLRGGGMDVVWCVDETRVLEPPPVSPETGISRFGLIRKLSSISRADFEAHYHQVHIPLVMATGPLFDGYVVDFLAPGFGDQWDGVVEQFFSSAEVWEEHDRLLFDNKPQVRADMHEFVADVRQFAAFDYVKLSGGEAAA